MSFDLRGAMGVHPAALRLREERTTILASNLANLNTPGYQAMDIDLAGAMARNNPKGGQGAVGFDLPAEIAYRIPSHVGQDGNTVELGVEQAAFAQNATDFQMSLTFLNLRLQGLVAAIGGNG